MTQVRFEAADDSASPVDERQWLPRHCKGDAQAFHLLMTRYQTLVYTFLHRYAIDPAHRDDLFQEIFLKIHLAAARYRPSEPLRPWLVSVVLNTLRNFLRSQGRGQAHIQQHERHNVVSISHAPGADQVTISDSQVAWLDAQITELPAVQREVLALAALKDLRMQDIAQVMQLPENTIKTHLRRARLALAEALVRQRQEEESA